VREALLNLLGDVAEIHAQWMQQEWNQWEKDDGDE